MFLVAVGSQCRVATLFVVKKGLQNHLLRQVIGLIPGIRRGPIYGALKLVHRFGGQLHLAMALSAIFQFLEIFLIHGEAGEVRNLRRVAKLLKRDIARKLAERIDVGGKLEVKFRSRVYVDRAKNKHLICGRRVQYLRDCLSFPNSSNLVLIKSYKIMEEPVWFGKVVRCLNSAS